MKELAEQVLLANNINWIPLSYINNVRVCSTGYEISFISGGTLTLSM